MHSIVVSSRASASGKKIKAGAATWLDTAVDTHFFTPTLSWYFHSAPFLVFPLGPFLIFSLSPLHGIFTWPISRYFNFTWPPHWYFHLLQNMQIFGELALPRNTGARITKVNSDEHIQNQGSSNIVYLMINSNVYFPLQMELFHRRRECIVNQMHGERKRELGRGAVWWANLPQLTSLSSHFHSAPFMTFSLLLHFHSTSFWHLFFTVNVTQNY